MFQIGEETVVLFRVFKELSNKCFPSRIVFLNTQPRNMEGTNIYCSGDFPPDFLFCEIPYLNGQLTKEYVFCPFNQLRADIPPCYLNRFREDFYGINDAKISSKFHIITTSALSALFVENDMKMPKMDEEFIKMLESEKKTDPEFFKHAMQDFDEMNKSFLNVVYMTVLEFKLSNDIWQKILLFLWIFLRGIKEEKLSEEIKMHLHPI